jgi:type IV pilus assembly protein PilM
MFLGIDIGRQYVKLACTEKTKTGYRLLDASSRLVPDSNSTYDPDKMDKTHYVMAIKELMRNRKINPKRAKTIISGISGSVSRIKQITVIDMPSEELDSAMTLEARKHVPLDGTDTIIDYQVLGSNPIEIDKIDIGLVACTKGIMDSHLGLIKDCGIKPGIVDVNPVAISNLFNFVKEMPDDGLVVIVDMGAVSSTLIVTGKGHQYFTRDLPFGGHHFVKYLSEKKELKYVEAQDLLYKDGFASILKNDATSDSSSIGLSNRTICDDIVEDIRRSLRFYAKQTGQSFFLKIFLTGGGAYTPGLDEFISQKLNIDTAIFEPLENMEVKNDLSLQLPSQFATAIGLSIRGGLVSV